MTATSGTVDDRAVVLPYAVVLGPGVTLGRDWTATDAWTRVLAHTVKKELVVRTAITRAVGSLVLVVSVTGIVFVTGMRTKSPSVVNGVRKLGRAMRPLAIKSAGGPGASASVVHHVGRTSGRSYSTPVGAVPTDDGFVIALPYGLSADWLKNVLASGSAAIAHDGSRYDVDRPEIVPLSAVEHQFSTTDQLAHRLFAVDQCLRIRRTVPDQPDTGTTG